MEPPVFQIATMQWVRERTSIPVPKILAYNLDQSHTLGAHILTEKACLASAASLGCGVLNDV